MSISNQLSTTSVESSGLTQRVLQEFASHFDRESTVVAAAPGRVNLIGEHIDYNDGFVLPMAIDSYVAIFDDLSQGQSESVHQDATLIEDDLADAGSIDNAIRKFTPDAFMYVAMKSLVGNDVRNGLMSVTAKQPAQRSGHCWSHIVTAN